MEFDQRILPAVPGGGCRGGGPPGRGSGGCVAGPSRGGRGRPRRAVSPERQAGKLRRARSAGGAAARSGRRAPEGPVRVWADRARGAAARRQSREDLGSDSVHDRREPSRNGGGGRAPPASVRGEGPLGRRRRGPRRGPRDRRRPDRRRGGNPPPAPPPPSTPAPPPQPPL